MKIEFSFTRDDIKAIWNYFRRYTTFSIGNARVLYFAVPLISLMLLLFGYYGGIYWLKHQGEIVLFASLVSIPIHLAFDKWKFNNWYKGSFILERGKEIFSITADDEGIIEAKIDSVETRMTWNAITDFYQNEVITVLSLSSDNCCYFPTKAMTREQRAELDELVARHVIRRKP
ncbi:MAG: YcxB family protein [Terracidiphilus sp.]|jgi:hypothetical protein